MDTIVVEHTTGFAPQDVILLENGIAPYYEIKIILQIDHADKRVLLSAPLIYSYDGALASIRLAGTDEVDLMRLVVKHPGQGATGAMSLSIDSGAAAIWTTKTKESRPNGWTNNSVQIPVSSIPLQGLELWVEATNVSTDVQDIQIRLKYAGKNDIVRATGIWTTLVEVRHNNADPIWPNATTPPKAKWDEIGGFGLRTTTNAGLFGHINVIGFEYQVSPARVVNEPSVKFDLARRKESNYWTLIGDTWTSHPTLFPRTRDEANDDSVETDESSAPTNDGRLYSSDAPGYFRGNFPVTAYVYRGTFEEFMRIAFGTEAPSGNALEGSRASSFYEWHARHSLHFDQNNVWDRTTGNDAESPTNDIGPFEIYPGFGATPNG